MENKKEIKQSNLWNDIYKIVSQIPKANVDYDAHNYDSISTLIEEMILKIPICTPTERAFLDELGENGQFISYNNVKRIRFGHIDEGRASLLDQEDFNTPLKDLVNDIQTKNN